MSFLYNSLIFKPLLNVLVFLYNTPFIADLGLAIVVLTVIIRMILYPLFHKSAVQQKKMQLINPKIKELQEKYKDDPTKQTQAILEVYKSANLNPFSGFLLLLVQMPILIAIYQIFLNIVKPEKVSGMISSLYSFVSRPEAINPTFLNLINLSEKSILMVVLATAAQYIQVKLAAKGQESGNPAMDRMSKQMLFIAPILTIVVLSSLPSAVGLYWFVGSVVSIIQQVIINKKLQNAKLD